MFYDIIAKSGYYQCTFAKYMQACAWHIVIIVYQDCQYKQLYVCMTSVFVEIMEENENDSISWNF